jgi:histidinol-phosphate/aromatic aminotransferase/cobyric acid decarboxylase-like protein
VLTATARVVRVVDQNVVVARGADDAVYCLAELLVSSARGMFFSSLFSADYHSLAPAMNSPVQS